MTYPEPVISLEQLHDIGACVTGRFWFQNRFPGGSAGLTQVLERLRRDALAARARGEFASPHWFWMSWIALMSAPRTGDAYAAAANAVAALPGELLWYTDSEAVIGDIGIGDYEDLWADIASDGADEEAAIAGAVVHTLYGIVWPGVDNAGAEF